MIKYAGSKIAWRPAANIVCTFEKMLFNNTEKWYKHEGGMGQTVTMIFPFCKKIAFFIGYNEPTLFGYLNKGFLTTKNVVLLSNS